MAVLSEADRAGLWAEFMRTTVNINNGMSGLTKAQLRAAVDAADQWAEDNAASYNTALPVAYRTAASARQKAALLMYVIRRRHEVS